MSYLSTPTRPTQDPLEKVLFRQRRLLFGVLLAALIAGAGYVAVTDTPRIALSRVCVQQAGPSLLIESGQRMSNYNYIIGQCEIVRSVPVVTGAIATLNTRNMKMFADVGDPVGYCRDSLRVRTGPDEFILTVSMESLYPAEAAAVVDAVVKSYIEYQSRQTQSSAGELARILGQEKDKCTAELRARTKALADFRQAHGTLSFDYNAANITLQKLTSLSTALTEAQVETMHAKAACQAAEASAGNPAILRRFIGNDQASSAIVSLEKELGILVTSLNELEVRLGTMTSRYSAQHPSVQATRAQVDQVKAKVAEKQKSLGEAWIAATRAQLLETQAKEREIRRALDEQQKSAMALNHAAAEYAALQADVQRAEKLHDVLESRIKDINVAEHVGALNISVLEHPDAQGKPTSFRTIRIFGLALLAGAGLGVLSVLLREMMDKRFRSSREVVEQLGVPVLGVVPRSSTRERHQAIRGEADAPQTTVEACRTLCAALRFGMAGEGVHRLLVTSPATRDGRTSVATGLAIAMAHTGQKVLLLEADFRGPALRQRFAIDSEAGLSNVLQRTEPLDRACHHTPIHGLDVLPAGPQLAAQSSLLEGSAFAALLENLSHEYDQIIIDAPPTANVAETAIVAAMCDAVVLVLRAGVSTGPESQHAMYTLRSVNAHVVGAVVNAAPRRQMHGNAYDEGWYCRSASQTRQDNPADVTHKLSAPSHHTPPSMAA